VQQERGLMGDLRVNRVIERVRRGFGSMPAATNKEQPCSKYEYNASMKRSVACITAMVVLAGGVAFPTEASAVVITQHPLPHGDQPATLISGTPSGLDVAGISSNPFASVTTTPTFAVTPAEGGAGIYPYRFGLGPNGRIWFTSILAEKAEGKEVFYGALYEIAPAGIVLRFRYPNPSGYPGAFVTGPEGALWIANWGARAIDRYVPGGALTVYELPGWGTPTSITNGPEGARWFTTTDGKIGRISGDGEIKEYLIEDGDTEFGEVGFMGPSGIAYGPDGALWFAESNTGRIGRMTASGQLEEFSLPNPHNLPTGWAGAPHVEAVVPGPDQAMWFTDTGNDMIGRITMRGEITEYPLPPTPRSLLVSGDAPPEPRTLVFGPEGQGWFTEYADELGSVNLTENEVPAPAPGPSANRRHKSGASRKGRRSCASPATSARYMRHKQREAATKQNCTGTRSMTFDL
jgi:virginiamycin B lyase